MSTHLTPDVLTIESQKENIQRLPGGRSVNGLVSGFKQGPSFKRRDQLSAEKSQFEHELNDIEELDDPLDVYIRYIRWCHDNYPQGNNIESGLLEILERCTTAFKDYDHYKNDGRYMKVWMEYAVYSDNAIDVFIYLAKKEIGKELALYYEEFAKVLEMGQKYNDAKSVYEIGISNGARPLNRLKRSMYQFDQRKLDYRQDKSDQEVKRVLTLKRGSVPISQSSEAETARKRPKISVFQDPVETGLVDNLFSEKTDGKSLASVSLRKKENIITATPWNGEILAQQRPPSKDGSSAKIPVYRDVEVSEDITQHEIHVENNLVSTIVTLPGKKPERVAVNLELCYPSGEEEVSLVELLFKSRRSGLEQQMKQKQQPKATKRELKELKAPTESKEDFGDASGEDFTHTGTFLVPLNDGTSNIPKSPTMTMFSRMAQKEVMNMFNSASTRYEDREDERSEANSTNYDGFVTETIHQQKTPPTQTETQKIESSPIIDAPTPIERTVSNPIAKTVHERSPPIDPFSENLRDTLLTSITPSLNTYKGYHNTKTHFIEAIRKFKSATDKSTKMVTKGSSGSIVNFCGDEIYSLKCELGQGGYGYVYLIENERGHLKALKAETICSNWEFYILSQVHLRLQHEPAINSRIVKPESLYMYKDESFLILNYLNQGTVLDVVNYYKDTNDTMEEILCIFFAVELLKVVEQLHKVDIIHGDLKADNCMISFKQTFNIPEQYSTQEEWQAPKLILIDFGRAIDLKLFPEGVEFIANFKTDEQDCPQMNNHETWTFEADYYGIAAILHTVLFGDYIRVTGLPNGKYKIKNNLKRYWQLQLWQPLFDILLNPYYNLEEKIPLIDELKYQRGKFEEYLREFSGKLGLKRVINHIERDLR